MAPKTASLTIHPSKPFKSSRLALPPSPFSPRLPLSPPPRPPTTATAKPEQQHLTHQNAIHQHPPPPSEPLNWLWQCHLCARVYRLAATRRCLDDGHFFCSGTTTLKRSRRSGRKVVRHTACASEFDYQGWKARGVWRRSLAVGGEEGVLLGGGKKDCWGTCDYPSECRWGGQYGVATPTLPAAPPPVPEKDEAQTRFEEMLLTIPVPPPATDEDGDGALQSPPFSPATGAEATKSPEEPTRQPSPEDLVSSAVRRKRRSFGPGVVEVPSPLASHPPSPTTVSTATEPERPSSAERVENVQGGGGDDGTALQRAFDEFDAEFRRSFERAGARLTGFVSAVRGKGQEEGKKGWL